ncbi:AAA family ATPase [Enterovirga rhinocerotis]|uniref:Putative ABC-type ATPase n=1 Tax=Enterovirga rhinocerotis TaxID=1339210 RepID=A0A4R7BWB2_9HYPH|nr:AAA family ATPase [Enterovirga rhinocerotis]TDR89763.1 putative ABC-type ATPase [Enterovirga rhinocerotis]
MQHRAVTSCRPGRMNKQPTIWMLAGPNGVGKTTYAFRHIRAVAGTVRFINLDEIARGLSPMDPEAEKNTAARIALDRFDAYLGAKGEGGDFSMETTLAGLTYLRRLQHAKSLGWRIHLLYFVVATPEAALARIARRVSEGGHAVPEADARRRFARSIANVPRYVALADMWRVFDNNGGQPKVAAEGRAGCIAYRGATDGLPSPLTAILEHLPACAEA